MLADIILLVQHSAFCIRQVAPLGVQKKHVPVRLLRHDSPEGVDRHLTAHKRQIARELMYRPSQVGSRVRSA